MMLLALVLLQASELESWGALLYEVEIARLDVEDVLAETKLKELPRFSEGEAGKLWAFRFRGQMPRCDRIFALGKGKVVLEGLQAHGAFWLLKPEPPRAPFPQDLVKASREGFAAAKKAHLGRFGKDPGGLIRWTERQIHELYAPLVTLNARGFAAVKGYQKLAEAGDGERSFWKVWAEREFLPRNEETRKVIAAKIFLVEGEGLSEPFLDFLLHQHSWARRHARWEAEKGEYDWGSRTNWPVAFSMECEQTYQKLLDRRARLVVGEE